MRAPEAAKALFGDSSDGDGIQSVVDGLLQRVAEHARLAKQESAGRAGLLDDADDDQSVSEARGAPARPLMTSPSPKNNFLNQSEPKMRKFRYIAEFAHLPPADCTFCQI